MAKPKAMRFPTSGAGAQEGAPAAVDGTEQVSDGESPSSSSARARLLARSSVADEEVAQRGREGEDQHLGLSTGLAGPCRNRRCNVCVAERCSSEARWRTIAIAAMGRKSQIGSTTRPKPRTR